jgi:uncharacterized protein YegP (UPF0339 family)
MGTFVIYIDQIGEYRWYLMAENSRKIADSGDGYRSRDDCEDSISELRRLSAKSRVEKLPSVETLIAN